FLAILELFYLYQLLVVEQHDEFVFIMDVPFYGFKWTEDEIHVEFDSIILLTDSNSVMS
mgnify:CR=1